MEFILHWNYQKEKHDTRTLKNIQISSKTKLKQNNNIKKLIYILKRVSDPSASSKLTFFAEFQRKRAMRNGLTRETSIAAVEYPLIQRVCDCPNPNIPVLVCQKDNLFSPHE